MEIIRQMVSGLNLSGKAAKTGSNPERVWKDVVVRGGSAESLPPADDPFSITVTLSETVNRHRELASSSFHACN